jgi:hypothetical protein
VEGLPQRLPNRLLVDLECGTDCPKTHPQPQPTRLRRNPLESERLPREPRELLAIIEQLNGTVLLAGREVHVLRYRSNSFAQARKERGSASPDSV